MVARTKGNKLANDQYNGTVTQILATCNMVPKSLTVSGDKDIFSNQDLDQVLAGKRKLSRRVTL